MLNNKKIGNILFYNIFIGYLLLTIFFTAYFIYTQYSIAQNAVIKDMNTIEKAFYSGLSNSIWHLDEQQINSNAQAIRSVQGIIGVSIISVNNEVLSQKGILSFEEKKYDKFLFDTKNAVTFSKDLISHTFKIVNKEFSADEILAYVTIYTSKDAIYSIVKENLFSILLYALVLIVVLWILFNYFSNKILTLPLNTIIQASKDLNTLEYKKITLNTDNKTELNLLSDTFNHMSKRITDSFNELSDHKINLENKVKERTAELELKNEELLESQEIANIARKNAEEANREKSMLLANISHELKTPLNGIMGLIYLSRLKVDDEEVVKNLSNIQEYSETLLRMINDLLDTSKRDSIHLKIENSTFNLRDLLDSLNQFYTIQCADKNIAFELTYDQDIPRYLISDSVRIHQVLTNILNNALKFTSKGKIRLNAEVQSFNEKYVKIKFIIKDDGIGIKKDELKNIFKAFYQTKESLNYFAGGSGLGLNISQKIVEQLNGVIWADSTINAGSTFYVVLDFQIDDKKKDSKETLTIDAKNIDNSNKKVLVVDDNQINIDVMSAILKSIGISCDTAFNGEEALSLVRLKKYDIVLTDIKMPVMNGWELAKHIRELYNKQELPIIAISANTASQAKGNLETYKINDYIQKPINPDGFLLKLKSYIHCNVNQSHPSVPNHIQNNSILDIKDALNRFVNNKKLYFHALNSFIEDYENSTHKINTLLNSHNSTELIDYLHTIKGISANLSAVKFCSIVTELHDSIKYGKQHVNLVHEYELSFMALKKEILQYINNSKETTNENSHLLTHKKEILNTLLGYCKSHNTKAIHFFDEISYEIRKDAFIAELERDISNYNFTKAKDKIEKILDSF